MITINVRFTILHDDKDNSSLSCNLSEVFLHVHIYCKWLYGYVVINYWNLLFEKTGWLSKFLISEIQ